MIRQIIIYKIIIIVISILTALIIGFLTIDAINETGNWNSFDLDFQSKDHIISSYGTLIGGILTFLAILFVIYQIQEERQFYYREKQTKKDSEQQDLLARLKMLTALMKSVLIEIKKRGEVMNKFAQDELNSPSSMNMMSFSSLNNFRRLVNMDELTNYKAFRLYFSNDEWEKLFINFNNNIDFYHENLNEMMNKFNSQISEKVSKQNKINLLYNKLISDSGDLIEEYHKIFNKDEYLNQPWSLVVNEFVLSHHTYLNDCEEKDEPNNLRRISDDIIFPFIRKGIDLRDQIGYDQFKSHDLISLASMIRKEINAMEMHCKYYAEDVEKYYTEYYSPNNLTLKNLSEIQEKLVNLTSVN